MNFLDTISTVDLELIIVRENRQHFFYVSPVALASYTHSLHLVKSQIPYPDVLMMVGLLLHIVNIKYTLNHKFCLRSIYRTKFEPTLLK